MIVAIAFIVQAAFELFLAFELPLHMGRKTLIFSATASGLVGVLIAAGWPSTSLFALGILLGVNFITTGIGFLALGRAAKNV